MKTRKNKVDSRRGIVAVVAVGSLGFLAAQPAAAFKFEGESVSGSFDSTISLGLQKRLSAPDCRIIGNDNGGCVPVTGTLGGLTTGGDPNNANPDFNYLQSDDGNLNYKKGDITSFALKGTHELFLKAPAGFSALVRSTWSRDFKAGDTRRTPLSDEAKDLAVQNWTWLDAWVAKEFHIGDRPAKVKVGNQVISWGEDIFIYGGINATNAIDLRKFHTPGTQLKEVFRPAPMISLNTGVTDNLSFEGYYQWKWNGFQFDPVGTYFSGVDVIGKGARGAYVPTSIANYYLGAGLPYGTVGDPGGAHGFSEAQLADGTLNPAFGAAGAGSVAYRADTRRPKDSGQFGLAARYKSDALKSEFGFYFIRYHDKIPFVGFINAGDASNLLGVKYFEDYGEKRNVFGVSMNTNVGPVAVGAEISYRPREGVSIDPTVPVPPNPHSVFEYAGKVSRGFVDEKKWQAHLTGFYLFAPSSPLGSLMTGLGAAEGFMLGEVAVTHYPQLDRSGFIPYLLPNYELPTRTSFGYVLSAGLTYPNVWASGWNLTPQIDFAHDVKGTSPNTIPFVEGRRAATLSLNFDRESRWKANLGITRYWGGGGNNLMRDRDMFYGSVSHSF